MNPARWFVLVGLPATVVVWSHGCDCGTGRPPSDAGATDTFKPPPDDAGPDAGPDAGADAGPPAFACPTGFPVQTLRDLKTNLALLGATVELRGVVVSFGKTTPGFINPVEERAEGWIAEGDGGPNKGVYLFKNNSVGPRLDTGTEATLCGRLIIAATSAPSGIALRPEFSVTTQKDGGLFYGIYTTTGTGTPPLAVTRLPTELSPSVGSPEYLGSKVRLAGPLTVTNPSPDVLRRRTSADAGFFAGFEVTGGVLVDDLYSRDVRDAGGVRVCDVAPQARDGGPVTFANGLVGFWDTYRPDTVVVDAGLPDGGLITVLWPTSCEHLNGAE